MERSFARLLAGLAIATGALSTGLQAAEAKPPFYQSVSPRTSLHLDALETHGIDIHLPPAALTTEDANANFDARTAAAILQAGLGDLRTLIGEDLLLVELARFAFADYVAVTGVPELGQALRNEASSAILGQQPGVIELNSGWR